MLLLQHLITLLTVAFVVANESEDPLIAKYPGLVSWFTSNGGVIDPRITIGYDEKGIRGMIALEAIPKDTVIINCPGDLVVRQSTDQCKAIEDIVEHLKVGEKSKWHTYFDFDDSMGSRIPSEWKEDSRVINELQGLPPAGETHKHINWFKSSCKKGVEPNDVEMRAFKIFLTRAADIGLIPMYGKFRDDIGRKVANMIPLTAIHSDLMNHHNGLINTYLERTDDGMGLKVSALTDIAPGEQIFNTVSTSYAMSPAQ
jgi:hypothetical protein